MNATWIRLMLFASISLVLFPSCVREPEPVGYVLEIVAQPGDTLAKICQRYQVSISLVWEYNNLSTTILKPGQHLLLPGAKQPKRPIPFLLPPSLPEEREPPTVTTQQPPPPTTPLRRYTVVARNDWGALPPKGEFFPMNGITRITIHHTTEEGGLGAKSDIDAVRAMARNHRASKADGGRGWADIGYHFLIGRDGKVYEGRSSDIQGAHCGVKGDSTNNKHNLGISLIGDFSHHEPSSLQEDVLGEFLADMQEKYKVPTTMICGHRDMPGTNTQCPGDGLANWLSRYKKSH